MKVGGMQEFCANGQDPTFDNNLQGMHRRRDGLVPRDCGLVPGGEGSSTMCIAKQYVDASSSTDRSNECRVKDSDALYEMQTPVIPAKSGPPPRPPLPNNEPPRIEEYGE